MERNKQFDNQPQNFNKTYWPNRDDRSKFNSNFNNDKLNYDRNHPNYNDLNNDFRNINNLSNRPTNMEDGYNKNPFCRDDNNFEGYNEFNNSDNFRVAKKPKNRGRRSRARNNGQARRGNKSKKSQLPNSLPQTTQKSNTQHSNLGQPDVNSSISKNEDLKDTNLKENTVAKPSNKSIKNSEKTEDNTKSITESKSKSENKNSVPIKTEVAKIKNSEKTEDNTKSVTESVSKSENKNSVPTKTEVEKTKNVAMNKINIKKEPSSESSSESSSSEEEKKPILKKKSSDEAVLCLGELKNFENLIEDHEEICVLCEKIGHTSFECFMECKNCGEKYHNLKKCLKPTNLSIMLQTFMEFCLKQCSQYNPEQKFSYPRDNKIVELIPTSFFEDNSINGSFFKKSKRKRKSSSKHDVKESDSSDSTSTSSSEIIRQKKKKSNKTKYPVPFFPMAAPHFNQMAAAAMMGFNPSAFRND